jgi:hypothetical protein
VDSYYKLIKEIEKLSIDFRVYALKYKGVLTDASLLKQTKQS